jgi:hypothetical protein
MVDTSTDYTSDHKDLDGLKISERGTLINPTRERPFLCSYTRASDHELSLTALETRVTVRFIAIPVSSLHYSLSKSSLLPTPNLHLRTFSMHSIYMRTFALHHKTTAYTGCTKEMKLLWSCGRAAASIPCIAPMTIPVHLSDRENNLLHPSVLVLFSFG